MIAHRTLLTIYEDFHPWFRIASFLSATKMFPLTSTALILRHSHNVTKILLSNRTCESTWLPLDHCFEAWTALLHEGTVTANHMILLSASANSIMRHYNFREIPLSYDFGFFQKSFTWVLYIKYINEHGSQDRGSAVHPFLFIHSKSVLKSEYCKSCY